MSLPIRLRRALPLGQSFFPMFLAFLPLFLGCGTDSETGPLPEEDGHVYVVAGRQGVNGNGGNGGPATEALLYWPIDLTVTPSGVMYVVDWNNHYIRKIDTDGIITQFIGSGFLGDDWTGPGDQIDNNHPTEIRIGPDGDYYIAAYHNWAIKKIDHETFETSRPIGTSRGFSGDGGPAELAQLDLPSSLIWDPAGNLYVLDQGNMRIRMVNPAGIITAFVGSAEGFADGIGEEAQFNFPGGTTTGTGLRAGSLEISPDGQDLYVCDPENHRLRKINIATRMVTTIAGTGVAGYSGDGGPAVLAELDHPADVEMTDTGEMFVSDRNRHVVRKIDAAGNITTVVGTGQAGSSPNGAAARSAMLNTPAGLEYNNATSTLYIADQYNHQIKKIRNP